MSDLIHPCNSDTVEFINFYIRLRGLQNFYIATKSYHTALANGIETLDFEIAKFLIFNEPRPFFWSFSWTAFVHEQLPFLLEEYKIAIWGRLSQYSNGLKYFCNEYTAVCYALKQGTLPTVLIYLIRSYVTDLYIFEIEQYALQVQRFFSCGRQIEEGMEACYVESKFNTSTWLYRNIKPEAVVLGPDTITGRLTLTTRYFVVKLFCMHVNSVYETHKENVKANLKMEVDSQFDSEWSTTEEGDND